PGEAPFNALVEGLLRWAITSIPRPDPKLVSADDLQAIADYLADDTRRREVFTYARLREFLGLNYVTELGTPLGPTGQPVLAAAESVDGSGNWGRWSRWCGGAGRPSISDLLAERGPVGLAGFTQPPAAGADALQALHAGAPEDSGTI